MTSAITCIHCAAPVPPEKWNRSELVACDSCDTPLAADVFPAFLTRLDSSGLAGPAAPEDASCFFHRRNRAVTPCDACGRFLCAVCDVELAGRHLCSTCMETGKKKGRLKPLENSRTLYGNIAVAIALYPLLIFYTTFLTAPIAIYVAIRYWKAPLSLVGGTRAPHVAAILIALMEIAGWLLLAGFLISRARTGHPHP